MTDAASGPRRPGTAVLLFAALFVLYNANGREVGTVDSQPAKFTAREVAVAGTLVLDRVIAERPPLADRPAFTRDLQGHYRSAYPVLPGLIAAVPATVLHATGLVDMDAPLAPNLVATLTASSLTALGVVLVYLALLRIVPAGVALLTTLGLGLGTNLWALASQTLWAHETVTFGLALALWAWLRPDASSIRAGLVTIGAVGLALAGAARPQTAPLLVLMLAWLAARVGIRRAVPAAGLLAAAGAASVAVNLVWFGHVLGAAPRLEAIHPEVHGVPGSFGNPLTGALGLLISPSRGLLVFSPIVVFAAGGLAAVWRAPAGARAGLGWLAAGAGLQLAAYSSYAVWWAGHTYGPRYAMDVLVPLAPLAALGVVAWARRGAGRVMAIVLLAWSVLVAGAGALIYPNERWNTSPAEVDRHHERLWQVLDSQIPRTLRSAPSPQTFDLFDAEAVRQPPE